MDLDTGRTNCLQPLLKRCYQYILIVVLAQNTLKQTLSHAQLTIIYEQDLKIVGLYLKVLINAGSYSSQIIISIFKPIVSSRRSLSLQKSLLSSGLIRSHRQPCPLPSILRSMLLAASMPSYAKMQL